MRSILALWVAATLGISGGCGPFGQSSSVAMVSGRDDHGQLERKALGLQRSPADTTISGTVEDGAFVRVTGREGLWAYVVTADRLQEGWIEDHYLRGEAVLIDPPPPRRVTFLDAEERGDVVYVLVRIAGEDSTEWVPAASLREVGAR